MVTDPNRLWSVGEKVQLQREGLMPTSMSLEISLNGITVLKAELKSMNSILTCDGSVQVRQVRVES